MLAEQEVNLKMKNDAADKLIVIVSAENEIVQKEKQFGKSFLTVHTDTCKSKTHL